MVHSVCGSYIQFILWSIFYHIMLHSAAFCYIEVAWPVSGPVAAQGERPPHETAATEAIRWIRGESTRKTPLSMSSQSSCTTCTHCTLTYPRPIFQSAGYHAVFLFNTASSVPEIEFVFYGPQSLQPSELVQKVHVQKQTMHPGRDFVAWRAIRCKDESKHRVFLLRRSFHIKSMTGGLHDFKSVLVLQDRRGYKSLDAWDFGGAASLWCADIDNLTMQPHCPSGNSISLATLIVLHLCNFFGESIMGFMGPGYICNHLVVTRIYWLLLACCPANLRWPLDQSPQSFCSLIQAIEMTGKLESSINLSRSEEIPGARYCICISIAYTEHGIDMILIVTSENRFLR